MDKWFNAYGMNGCLYEVSRPSDSDFTANYKQDFLKIGLETSVAIVSAVIENNQLIKEARDGAKKVEAEVTGGGSGGSITVDSALSGTSENPVQNKVIKTALDGKASTAVATTTTAGLMSATDKSNLDTLYADYLSASTALG